MNAARHHDLGITRFAFTGGEPLDGYAGAFRLDLFLSTDEKDVQRVADAKVCAAAVLYPPPEGYSPPDDQLRVAFDGDAVLFSEDSELVYKAGGLQAFHDSEDASKNEPLADGPFAAFLRKLAKLKESLLERVEYSPVRLAVVTARNAPAETRVITTLRAWNVYVDQAFFLGGMPKDRILTVLRPHIFFDDQLVHLLPASSLVPSGRVPYRTGSLLNPTMVNEDVPVDGSHVFMRSPADITRVS